MKTLFKILVLVFITISYSCKQTGEQNTNEEITVETDATVASSSSDQTKAVLEHHLKAFGENNLAEIMADYATESILITPDSTYTGLEAIESLFTGLFPLFPTEGTVLEMDNMVIHDELAYILWHADTPVVNVPLGTDTFIIADGKIVKQTFAGIINPKE